MLKKILMVFTLLYAAVAFAAVDANQATVAELDSVKGIGPVLSGKIMDERKKAPFKDWNDLINRVNGVGATSAARYSEQGLTVNGSAFSGGAVAPPKVKKSVDGMKSAPAAAKETPKDGKGASTSTSMGDTSMGKK